MLSENRQEEIGVQQKEGPRREFWGWRKEQRHLLNVFIEFCSTVSVQPCLPSLMKFLVKLTLLAKVSTWISFGGLG